MSLKMKATYRQSRTTDSGESCNANHVTLNATRKGQDHIREDMTQYNQYFKITIKNVDDKEKWSIQGYKGSAGGFDAKKHEREMYEQIFGDGIEARNARYKKEGHSEKAKTIKQIYEDKKTCPMETLWQIGNMKTDISPEDRRKKLIAAFNATYKEIRLEYGEFIKPLTIGLHLDEAVDHLHFRFLMGAKDKFGHFMPNQNAALKAMGFERPDPTKPLSKFNNPLISFTDTIREKFYRNCEKQGIEIDREVTSQSHRRKTLLQYQCEQLTKEVAEARQQAQTAQMALDKVLGDTQTLENKIVALEASQKALEERNRILSQEKGTLKSENQSLRQNNQTLQNENEELYRQSNALQAEIRTLIQQRNALRTAEKEAREARDAAVQKLAKIEEFERQQYDTAKRFVKKYQEIPAQEEKKSITGKVKQEALPKRVVIATEDLEELQKMASIYERVVKNTATIEEINKKLNTDEVVQGLRQQIQSKNQEIKGLKATITQRDKTIKQQSETIQQHQDYLDARHLNHDFEKHQNEDIEQTLDFIFPTSPLITE